mgnify:CR=1 FL=1
MIGGFAKKKVTRISDVRTHFADWRILNAQGLLTDFFNISAWIMDFVCFGVRIPKINLAVSLKFFLPDLYRTRLHYSGNQQHATRNDI